MKKVLKIIKNFPEYGLKFGDELTIVSEDEKYYFLETESEDGSTLSKLPKKFISIPGIVYEVNDNGEEKIIENKLEPSSGKVIIEPVIVSFVAFMILGLILLLNATGIISREVFQFLDGILVGVFALNSYYSTIGGTKYIK